MAALDLATRKYIPERVVFLPSHLSKQSRPSHHGIEFIFPYFKDDIILCPVQTLKVYEHKTSTYRSHSETNPLLRSFIGSHGPVSLLGGLRLALRMQEWIHQNSKLTQ